tara:strand:- start:58 stop:348 length:291 start_codon:yes stop_codon:yes gene_type:complete
MKSIAARGEVDGGPAETVPDHPQHMQALTVVVSGIVLDQGPPEGVDLVQIYVRRNPPFLDQIENRRTAKEDQATGPGHHRSVHRISLVGIHIGLLL